MEEAVGAGGGEVTNSMADKEDSSVYAEGCDVTSLTVAVATDMGHVGLPKRLLGRWVYPGAPFSFEMY